MLIARWAHAPDAEVDRVVGLLGLGRMTDRPTATYSSGMRQVLATARRHDMRRVGPTCLGVLPTDPEVRLTAWFGRGARTSRRKYSRPEELE